MKRERERDTHPLSPRHWLRVVACACVRACTTLSPRVLTESQGRAKAYFVEGILVINSLYIPFPLPVLPGAAPVSWVRYQRGRERGEKEKNLFTPPPAQLSLESHIITMFMLFYKEAFAGYRSGHKFSPLGPPSPFEVPVCQLDDV